MALHTHGTGASQAGTSQGWGYGTAVTNGRDSGRDSNGMGSLGSMGGVTTSDPTVREMMQRSGATEGQARQLLEAIGEAIRNGIPPEHMQVGGNFSLSELEMLYERSAQAQGRTLDEIRTQYEQQRAADMAALQGMGAGIVAGATGLGLSANNKRQFAGLAQDAQMTIAEEGKNLTEKTSGAQDVPLARLGELTPNVNTGQQRERGQGAGMMA